MQRNTHAREDLFDLINMHKQHIFDMLGLSVRGGVNESLSLSLHTRTKKNDSPDNSDDDDDIDKQLKINDDDSDEK